jgi:hypothetical protein
MSEDSDSDSDDGIYVLASKPIASVVSKARMRVSPALALVLPAIMASVMSNTYPHDAFYVL